MEEEQKHITKVFISYSRADYVNEYGDIIADSDVAHIVDTLRESDNIELWIDIKAKYSGQYFTSVLAKRILWADKVLFLSSQNSNASEWARKEVLFAAEHKKKILPIRIDDCPYHIDLELVLIGIDYIEYYRNPLLKAKDILDNVLNNSNEETLNPIEPGISTGEKKDEKQPEKKGCFNLNVSIKGCVFSMTILLCICLVVGFGIPDLLTHKSNIPESTVPQEQSIAYADDNERSSDELPDNPPQTKESAYPPCENTSQPSKDKSKKRKQPRHRKKGLTDSLPNPTLQSEEFLAQGELGNDSAITSTLKDDQLIAQNTENQATTGSTSERTHPRSGISGPTRSSYTVLAGHTDIYNITFRGGEQAIVMVSGDGDTDLDLSVYDENGNLIASDTDGTDQCVCTFTPRWTGRYTIRIKNNGRVYNRYTLYTN